MPELRTFSADDLAELDRLGQVQLAAAYERGAAQVNRFRRDLAAGNADGFKGEWAVRDSLALPRFADLTGHADPGYDLTGPRGHSIQVRYTPYRSGRLMCLASRPFSADAAVLVVARYERSVSIVGGVWVTDFSKRCHRRDFGHGPTDYLEQRELEDWSTFKEKL